MIVSAVIKKINLSSSGLVNNKYEIEIPLFKMPGDENAQNYTIYASASIPAGMSSIYEVGDKVFVGFFNNDFSFPIIIGKIYQGIDTSNRGLAALNSLNVSGECILPKNTKIGDLTYEDLANMKSQLESLRGQ